MSWVEVRIYPRIEVSQKIAILILESYLDESMAGKSEPHVLRKCFADAYCLPQKSASQAQ